MKETIVEDQLVWLIKNQAEHDSPILNIHQSKECKLMVTLATEYQLRMLQHYCTYTPFSILGVDMTYNCGQYYVTPTTVRHPMLLHTKTLVEPTIIGPTIIHTDHNEYTYRAFASDIVNKNNRLKQIKSLGSDRQMEMYNGFKYHMPDLKHVICKKHIEDNIKSYLNNKNIAKANQESLLNDIFIDLTNCFDDDDFDETFEILKGKWDEIDPDIHKWFKRYQTQGFKSSMTTCRRVDAGLADKYFYNNANESANKLLKAHINRKSSIPKLVEEWVKVCTTQKNNCERTIIGEGLFKLKGQYCHLKVNKSVWYKKTGKHRLKSLDKLFTAFHKPESSTTKTSLLAVAVEDSSKRKGRKLNENPRKRTKHTIDSKFCSEDARHESHVTFALLDKNLKIKKCYHCGSAFDRSLENIVACTKTYRAYREKESLTIHVSRKLQNVYVHLKCLKNPDFANKNFHICNYLQMVIPDKVVLEIQKYGTIE